MKKQPNIKKLVLLNLPYLLLAPQQVNVPEGLYTVVCHDGMVCADGLGKMHGGKVTVAPQSALIIYKTE